MTEVKETEIRALARLGHLFKARLGLKWIKDHDLALDTAAVVRDRGLSARAGWRLEVAPLADGSGWSPLTHVDRRRRPRTSLYATTVFVNKTVAATVVRRR